MLHSSDIANRQLEIGWLFRNRKEDCFPVEFSLDPC